MRKKYEAKSKPLAVAPADICESATAKVYSTNDFESIELEEITVSVVGEVYMVDNERETVWMMKKLTFTESWDGPSYDTSC